MVSEVIPINIARARMLNQRISGNKFTYPAEVVSWLGAVQAQDFMGALWAVGLRMKNATEASVEQALADRSIVRTWPMRGTLHFIAATDARWMLRLMGERVLRGMKRRMGQLDLDDRAIDKARTMIMKSLHGSKQLTRRALYEILHAGGIAPNNSRGLHLIGHIALEGHICFGAREGKQQTLTLLEDWVPKTKVLTREESLAELARRYYTGHGPATVQDCMWWSGLKKTEVHEGLELSKKHLAQETVDGKTYWFSPNLPAKLTRSPVAQALPSFDEFLVGYRDRTAALDAIHNSKINPGRNGMLSPVIVIDGQVVAVWKRILKNKHVMISMQPFAPLSKSRHDAALKALGRYAAFIGLPHSHH